MEEFPWPEGTLVRCIGSHGLPVRTTCELHIFQTVTPPMPVEDYTECGFIQAAKCLVCCYVTSALDADFWRRRADGMDLAALSGELHALIEGYHEALDFIGRKMTGQVAGMRDFG
jgi:hypothetical protein